MSYPPGQRASGQCGFPASTLSAFQRRVREAMEEASVQGEKWEFGMQNAQKLKTLM